MHKRAVHSTVVCVLAVFVALTLATVAPASERATTDTVRGQSARIAETSASPRSAGVLSIHDLLRIRVLQTLRAFLDLREERSSVPSGSTHTISDDPDPTSSNGPIGDNPLDPPEDDDNDDGRGDNSPNTGDNAPYGGHVDLISGTPVFGG